MAAELTIKTPITIMKGTTAVNRLIANDIIKVFCYSSLLEQSKSNTYL